MKKIFSFIAAFLICISAFSQDMNIGLLNGPSCIPCAALIENTTKIDETAVNYQIFASPQDLLPKMIKKEIDIGFMPVNVAAKSYSATKQQIICVAVTGEGNLALISSDSKVNDLKKLKGKTVYVAGQGATPEYITRYLLEKADIPVDSKDGVTLNFSIPTNQLVPQFIAGKIENVILPEPFITILEQNYKKKISKIDLQENGWKQYYIQNYPMTVMVVRKEFAEENPHLLKSFIAEYENALTWTLQNPEIAAEICERVNLGLKKEVVQQSIPKANYVYIPASKGKMIIESLLGVIMDSDTSFLNGILPDQGFYYKNE
ncbi:MAG: ABC transporter substrate-binding protein [Treponema sp.]|nr:ABC transporter substrate-binding protein [Treponema sp.]